MNWLWTFFEEHWFRFLITMVISYLLGSISFSIIFTRIFYHKEDIRTMGSKNAGFTNVLRSAGKVPAILTFIGDFGKCFLAVAIGKWIFTQAAAYVASPFVLVQYGAYLAGFFCLIGHIYPCFFGFRGGKGVLTTAAMVLQIDWRVFLIGLGIFLIVFAISRIVSLGSISFAVLYPGITFCITYFLDYLPTKGQPNSDIFFQYVIVATVFSFLIALVVIVKHRENIKRLLHGTEKRIKSKD